MSDAQSPLKQPRSQRGYQKSGHYKRVRTLKRRGYNAVDGRTYAGREAKHWRALATERKGCAGCPFHIRLEIDAAMFDLWLLLELADAIAVDAKKRRAVLNRRAKALPKLHEQYQSIVSRFAKRCEALELDKAQPMDLATRLQLAQRTADQR
jgi:hypothetical protein